MSAVRWLAAFAGLWLCFGQEPDIFQAAQRPLPAEILLLARIKMKAAENLRRLPNYTCTQTIERFKRAPKARKFEPHDTLRLEVALVEGKELFSWPGAGRFEEKGIGEIVGRGGAIGNGNFALHAKSVFLSRSPTYTFVGETVWNGRRAVRYDYLMPRMLSSYQIKTSAGHAYVGYHGSFWVDADSLDLIRLEVRADNLPPNLDLTEASDAMEYHRQPIGDGEFLLPQSSELTMIDLFGGASRNRTQFSACRQYAGESKLSFEEPSAEIAAPAPQRKPIRLPVGMTLEVRLETAVRSGTSATGDPIKALVARDVKKDGEIVVPKGAVLTGRITRLEKRKGFQQDIWILGLDFSDVEFDRSHGDLRVRLWDAGLSQNGRGGPGRGRQSRMWPTVEDQLGPDDDKTGGLMLIRDSRVVLPRGHLMVWRTEPE